VQSAWSVPRRVLVFQECPFLDGRAFEQVLADRASTVRHFEWSFRDKERILPDRIVLDCPQFWAISASLFHKRTGFITTIVFSTFWPSQRSGRWTILFWLEFGGLMMRNHETPGNRDSVDVTHKQIWIEVD
jgi:hypothetical protein